MNYATPVVTTKSKSQVSPRAPAVLCIHPATARLAANEATGRIVAPVSPVEPMLLVHQERVETFRLIAVALRDGFRILRRSITSLSGVEKKPNCSIGPFISTPLTPVIIASTPASTTTMAFPDSGSSTPFQRPRG